MQWCSLCAFKPPVRKVKGHESCAQSSAVPLAGASVLVFVSCHFLSDPLHNLSVAHEVETDDEKRPSRKKSAVAGGRCVKGCEHKKGRAYLQR